MHIIELIEHTMHMNYIYQAWKTDKNQEKDDRGDLNKEKENQKEKHKRKTQ